MLQIQTQSEGANPYGDHLERAQFRNFYLLSVLFHRIFTQILGNIFEEF